MSTTNKSNEDSQLVHRFVNFAFKTINTDMSTFFTANMPHFTQDYDSYLNQGETLQQYQAYQEYTTILDAALDQFVADEGFRSSEECMVVIGRLVKEDMERHKEKMVKIMEALKKAQGRAIKAIKKAQRRNGSDGEGKSESKDDSDDDDSNDDESEKQDLNSLFSEMIFFNPTTLDQLVEMVMNLGEYQTFSMMMRMKVQQNQVMRMLLGATGATLAKESGKGEIEGRGSGREEKGGDERDDTETKTEESKVDAGDDDFFFEEMD